jgi:hypothetical protein
MPRRRQTKEGKRATNVAADRMSLLYRVDGRLIEFEQQWSAAPLDPASWPGWRISRLGPGWVATRAR